MNSEFQEEFNEVVQIPFLERQRQLLVREQIDPEETMMNRRERTIDASILISQHSENSYNEEYEEEMAKIDREKEIEKIFKEKNHVVGNSQNISMEKTIGGWKSEFESEGEGESMILQINPQEIKSAVNVLKKANLLNPKNGKLLSQLTELLKEPNNSHNLELLVQLANINKRIVQAPDISSNIPKEKVRSKVEQDTKDPFNNALNFSQKLESSQSIMVEEKLLSSRHSENIKHCIEKASNNLKDVEWEDLINVPDFIQNLKFDETELVNEKFVPEHNESRDENPMPKEYLKERGHYSPNEIKASPAKKGTQAIYDYQSTGISSQSGLRSRITLKTVGSDNSLKVFTPGSKSIEESFKYM